MGAHTGHENETTTEPVLVRRAGPADAIAYVWYELGYQPQDSVVVVAMHGVRRRLGSIARADLPPPHTRRSVLVDFVRGLVRPVEVTGADQVLVLICSGGALHRPEPAVVRVLMKELPKAGIEVTDVLGVTTAGYRSLLCADLACCPPEGHSLAGVMATATAAAQVVMGRSFGADESELVADVEPATADWDDDDRDDADWAGDEDAPEEARRWEWWCWWRDEISRRKAGSAEAAGAPGTGDLVKVFWSLLDDLILRDVILMHAMGTPSADCEQLLRAGAGGVDGYQWDLALRAVAGRRPSTSDLRLARDLLAGSARHARPGRRAPILAVLAWLAWFEGNGGRARLLVQQALDDTPGYSLALLVDSFLLGSLPPPWYLADPPDVLDD